MDIGKRRWQWPLTILAGLVAIAAHASGAPEQSLVQRIEALQAGYAVQVLGDAILARQTLQRFYENRGYRLAWAQESRREALADAIERLPRDGLNPADYHGELLQELARRPEATLSDDLIADRDLLFTDAFLLAASHLADGKVNPESIHAEWTLTGRRTDIVPLLTRALDNGSLAQTLQDLRPRNADYLKLVQAREHLSRLLGQPWLPIPDGPSIRPGDTDTRLPVIRRRLIALEDLSANASASSELYDGELEAALPDFQARHGLEPDGIIGRQTLDALNLMPVERIRQIDASLERWRWLPDSLGDTYVLVNIAGFRLQMVRNGKEVLHSRVIVGRPFRQTPVFSDRIRYLVFNPTWTVPRKLMIEDQLPEIQRDPDYLERLGIEVFEGWGADRRKVDPGSVDWDTLSKNRFPYQLVQGPGPKNALGRVKFMFPNRYDVYLHDTPSRYLFGRQERTFSSGCIRVERPFDLAEQLLANDMDWDRQRINDLLATGETTTVVLPIPIPIHIQYWTAWVDEQGHLQFRDDIYHRDGPLINELRHSALADRQLPTPVAVSPTTIAAGRIHKTH
ncbi:peptidoglycan-binding domain 1 protein [Marinobacter santoriniensis NKSG1]|uniref:Peptidoglycan-binding domain 1 protein n=1 Tax=Marinobacter santoriniensis NKSG1 TaxID=1288826 RepID=M7CRA2_9GAMM|nr:L,D-transpeptidase family protein [Marinobacter santoriniensis]EMP56171.1 peptidoglycan-binding domain 1 protein [Marinobacter santoriniensis NKSG1]